MSPAPRIRVFIVDDHPLVREWLGLFLRLEADIEVCGEAEEPTSALAAMTSLSPAVAIVDLSLKRGSGLELIKALRLNLPAIRVLVLSMHEEIADVARSMRAGALGYVMKSESTDQIVAAIREVNAGRVYANSDTLAQLAGRIMRRTTHDPSAAAEALSDREMDVFRRLGDGHSTRRISEDLGVSQKTIQTYCARIKEKLGFSDGSQLMQAAIRLSQSNRS